MELRQKEVGTLWPRARESTHPGLVSGCARARSHSEIATLSSIMHRHFMFMQFTGQASPCDGYGAILIHAVRTGYKPHIPTQINPPTQQTHTQVISTACGERDKDYKTVFSTYLLRHSFSVILVFLQAPRAQDNARTKAALICKLAALAQCRGIYYS